ncbi:hypothetical protein [Methylobacterium sp. WL6]|uniref:hypothetical protein n=1 Tax=Methylobacterium sp. WL6 TaxID=2603901 RepID=UPI0011CAFB63|nr:hypothetical protein [Methylobacterium sp. WL6]TXN71482.1 hypothetical protein FV230_08465 [Methylobacterium sp. WL6]
MHHPAWASPIGARKRSRAQDALRRIAQSLDVPVEVLMQNAQSEFYPDATAEMVRLWFKIWSQEGRDVVLKVIREIAQKAEAELE